MYVHLLNYINICKTHYIHIHTNRIISTYVYICTYCKHLYRYIHIYIYIHLNTYTYMHIHIFTYNITYSLSPFQTVLLSRRKLDRSQFGKSETTVRYKDRSGVIRYKGSKLLKATQTYPRRFGWCVTRL